jgi:ParB family transcriptional regulator, chromosome partitioning protein
VAERPRGMGRGLAAILSVSSAGDDAEQLREIAVELISANRRQPRRHFDEASLQALADSIGSSGLLQPVLVRPRAGGTYELIAGERRWRAARMAGLERIPALVRPREDAAALELALVENMAREDLNPVEEARACAALVEELGLTREEVGRRVARSRVAVSNLIRLLELPDEALEMLERGDLSEGHGRALLLAGEQADRRLLARRALAGNWSVRETERHARDAGAARTPAASPRRQAAVGADEHAAIEQVADALGAALGAEVRVRPHGDGYRVELALESIEDGLALARRLRPRAVA